MIDADSTCPPNIPPNLFPGIKAHALMGQPTGSFLSAVFANDLRAAMTRADHVSRAAMLDIVRYIYNELPGDSHGSWDIVKAWRAQGGLAGSK